MGRKLGDCWRWQQGRQHPDGQGAALSGDPSSTKVA